MPLSDDIRSLAGNSMTRIGCPTNRSAVTSFEERRSSHADQRSNIRPVAQCTGQMRCEARLAYDDEKTALEFLTKAFGLHEQTRMQGPDDSLMAWLEFGRSTLMIGRSGPEHTTSTALVRPASPRPR